jgi:hypothetical protein
MLKNRSIFTLISLVLAIAYTIYILSYFAGVNAETTSDAEAIGAGLATLLVLPSVFVLGIGVILGLIGFFNRSTGLQLTAAILYSVAGPSLRIVPRSKHRAWLHGLEPAEEDQRSS